MKSRLFWSKLQDLTHRNEPWLYHTNIIIHHEGRLTHLRIYTAETVTLTLHSANSWSGWLSPQTNHSRRYGPRHAEDSEQGAFQHPGAVRCARAGWQPTVRGQTDTPQLPASTMIQTNGDDTRNVDVKWCWTHLCYHQAAAVWYSDRLTTSATLKCLNNTQFPHGLVCAAQTCWCHLHITEI